MQICGIRAATLLFLIFLCLPLSYAHTGVFKSMNSTLLRVKRQNCEYTCDNGDCISSDNVCDGTVECADGSDETPAKCSDLTCNPYLFRCNYGPCINKDKVCNGIKDCADNSDETGPGCASASSACTPSEHRCNNGQCIDVFRLCDGKKDCDDGSDETKEKCGGVTCQPFLFQCSYGPCVDKSARCNGVDDCVDRSDELGCPGGEIPTPVTFPTPVTPATVTGGGCILPYHPPNGQFQFRNNARYSPNTAVPSSVEIVLTCHNDYKLTGETNEIVSYCINGKWIPENIPEDVCKKRCRPLNDPTVTATCWNGNNNINCTDAIEGTRADTKCVTFFTSGVRSRMFCRNGYWEPNIGSCVPECGKKRVNVQVLAIGGEPTKQGEYPWMIAVYNHSSHICGGSIISRRFVISAAHCFTDINTGEAFDKKMFTVIAGKYHREIDDDRDKDTKQVRRVEQLILHDEYRGRYQNYRYDIALLRVKDFVLNFFVQPVCVDWDKKYDQITLVEGNTGVVAGWGFTEEGGNPAEELKKISVPVKNKLTCKQYLPTEFYSTFYISDKMCAGYINNATSVCSGDSGGGYYFRTDAVYYIRGIVSLSPPSEVGCNKNLFALYTRLSEYNNWIADKTDQYI